MTEKDKKIIENNTLDIGDDGDFNRLNRLKEDFNYRFTRDYIHAQKVAKQGSKDFDGNFNIMDAIVNPLQQVGVGTKDFSFNSLLQTSNRNKSWDVSALDKTIRDIPYFINTANWKATLALKNGIDISSKTTELNPDKINELQKKVYKNNPQLYKWAFEGEIYGFSGGLLVIKGQDSEEELQKPIDISKIEKGDFLGIKLLTRLYSVIPDTSELLGIEDIVDAKYWGNADLIGKPKYYLVNLDGKDAMQENHIKVHTSRIITYNTNPLSYVEEKISLNMGVSMLERAYSEMARFETLWGQTVKMAQRTNIPVLKTDDSALTMSTLSSDEALAKMLTSLSLMKRAMSNSNMISIGKDDDFSFANSQYQEVPQILEKAEALLASALDVPISVATRGKLEKDELKEYAYIINRIRESNFKRVYDILIPIVYANEFGGEIPEFDFIFKSIYEPTQKENAEALKIVAEILQILYQNDIADIKSIQNMWKVANTNISDITQEITPEYMAYATLGVLENEKILNKSNRDIVMSKYLNQGKDQDGVSGVHNPESDTGGKEKGGNPKTTKKPTPIIEKEKK